MSSDLLHHQLTPAESIKWGQVLETFLAPMIMFYFVITFCVKYVILRLYSDPCSDLHSTGAAVTNTL